MTVDGIQYLYNSNFSSFIFLQASGAVIYGTMNTLNVAFAHNENDISGDSHRLGIIYACWYWMFFVPLVADNYTTLDNP